MKREQIPRHFNLWPAFLQRGWIKQHRPEEYEQIFGKERKPKMPEPKLKATGKFYVLQIIGDVEPTLHGPFDSEDERDAMARSLRDEDTTFKDGIYAAQIKNGKLEVDSYSGAFFFEAPI